MIYVLAILFLLLGTVMLFGLARQAWYGLQTESWPTTSGVIRRARLEERMTVQRGGGRAWRVAVEYEYEVDGRHFNSRHRCFGEGWYPEESARRLLLAYREGQYVDVHYHPDRPEIAVLEPGRGFLTDLWLALGLIFGGVLFGLGVWLLVAASTAR